VSTAEQERTRRRKERALVFSAVQADTWMRSDACLGDVVITATKANTRLEERQRVRTVAQARTRFGDRQRVRRAAHWGRIHSTQHVTTVPQANTTRM
jgi:hypothetical protein